MKKYAILLSCFFLISCVSKKHDSKQAPAALPSVKAQETPRPVIFDSARYKHYSLLVDISAGMVDFNNIDGDAAYKPVSFVIANGEVKSLTITKSGDNFFNSKTLLTVQYQDGVLLLDVEPNPYALKQNQRSPTTLIFSDAWVIGAKFVDVSTKGEAGLNRVDVSLKLIKKDS